MKVNFEMEPNELIKLFELCSDMVNKEAETKINRSELETKAQLAKARNELSQFVIGKTINDK